MDSSSLTNAVNSSATSIKSVSPQQFATVITHAIMMLYNALSGILAPLAMFLMLVSLIIFMVGALFHSSNLRKMGMGGFFGAGFGMLVYFSIPVIVGFIKSMAALFQ
jgi:Zn-dependent membrane protease YugP